jgi:hypothetical protein
MWQSITNSNTAFHKSDWTWRKQRGTAVLRRVLQFSREHANFGWQRFI